MSNSDEHGFSNVPALMLSRRQLLAGTSVALGTVPLQVFGTELAAGSQVQLPAQKAVFQQQVYFNTEGSGEVYDPPVANASTRDYRNSLSEEEFLKRHWFR